MYTHDKPRSTFSIFLTPPPMRTLPHIARMEWLNCNSHAWACLPQTHADLREVLARHNTREEQVIRLSPEVPYLNETAEIRWGGNIRVDTFNVQRPTSSLAHLEPSHKRAVGSTIPLRFQVYTAFPPQSPLPKRLAVTCCDAAGRKGYFLPLKDILIVRAQGKHVKQILHRPSGFPLTSENHYHCTIRRRWGGDLPLLGRYDTTPINPPIQATTFKRTTRTR